MKQVWHEHRPQNNRRSDFNSLPPVPWSGAVLNALEQSYITITSAVFQKSLRKHLRAIKILRIPNEYLKLSKQQCFKMFAIIEITEYTHAFVYSSFRQRSCNPFSCLLVLRLGLISLSSGENHHLNHFSIFNPLKSLEIHQRLWFLFKVLIGEQTGYLNRFSCWELSFISLFSPPNRENKYLSAPRETQPWI